MCEFASLVLTKDKAFFNRKNESHQYIIKKNNLYETDSTHMRINLVKIEMLPNPNSLGDPSTWFYHVDQDLLPKWYDKSICESRARAALKQKLGRTLISRLQILDTLIADLRKIAWFTYKTKPCKEWKTIRSYNLSSARSDCISSKPYVDQYYRRLRTQLAKLKMPISEKGCTNITNLILEQASIAIRTSFAMRRQNPNVFYGNLSDAREILRVLVPVILKDANPKSCYTIYAKKRFDVFRRGWACACDVDGRLYVYGKQSKKRK